MGELSFRVAGYNNILEIRESSKIFAIQLGFSNSQLDEIILLVSELASELIKSAHNGCIKLQAITVDDKIGIEFKTEILKPLNISKSDFTSIRHLVDEIEINHPELDSIKTLISCKKWLSSKTAANKTAFDFGIVCRQKPGEELNGDAYTIISMPDHTRIAIIDGLGHGAFAYNAAMIVKDYVENHNEQSVINIFYGAGLESISTNGVVMAVADFNTSENKFTFASIGNIEARLIDQDAMIHLPVRRGILGRNSPPPKITELDWKSNLKLILHTDGVSSKWNWDDFIDFSDKPALFIAEHMFKQLQLQHDDATLIVIK